MTNKTVVGLGGLLRSGKDTVADYLVEKHGYTKMGMSDPLLKMALVLDPIIPIPESPNSMRLSKIVDLVGYVQAKQYPEVRRFLQMLGTEVGRNMIDSNLWVNLAEKNIEKVVDGGGKVVLTGIRFENELNLIRDMDGENVWVERPSVRQNTEHSQHASEATLTPDDFDRTLLNHGSLEDLYWVVDKWVEA